MQTIKPEAILAARKAMGKYGVPASVTLAQYIDESGNGEHMPPNSNNPFGIKANSPPWVECPTIEVINGNVKHIIARFKQYPSLDVAFDDHARLLANGKPYQSIKKYFSLPFIYARKLTGIYATDPSYGQKLITLIHEYNLLQYDVPVGSSASTAVKALGVVAGGTVIAEAVSTIPQYPTNFHPTAMLLISMGFIVGILLMICIASIAYLIERSKPKPTGDLTMAVLAAFEPVIASIQANEATVANAQATIATLTSENATLTAAATQTSTDQTDTLNAVAAAANLNPDGTPITPPAS